MAEVNITINGRSFAIFCEDGQEQRVTDLGNYVDSQLKEIAAAGAGSNEAHLLVLTSLMLSDQIFDLRNDVSSMGTQIETSQANQNDESDVAGAIDEMAQRIERLSGRIQNA